MNQSYKKMNFFNNSTSSLLGVQEQSLEQHRLIQEIRAREESNQSHRILQNKDPEDGFVLLGSYLKQQSQDEELCPVSGEPIVGYD